MKNSALYQNLWIKHRESIIQLIKKGGRHSIQMHKSDFDAIGNRKSYSFNLEFMDGRVANNISGSAVARDLATVLKSIASFNQVSIGRHIKINLDKGFRLHVRS